MFGKLKEKLKSWFSSAKEKIAGKEGAVEETKEEKAEKPEEELAKPEKEKKQGKKKISKKKKQEAVKKPIKELIQETPLEFQAATQKYEPDLEKIKELEKQIESAKETIQEIKEPEKKSFFQRLKSKFSYKITEDNFNEIFNDLEMLLLENNIALEVVEEIKKKLHQKLIGKEIKKENLESEIKTELKNSLNEILIEPDNPLDVIGSKKPFVVLFYGINGSGKTTSIAKFAYLLKKHKHSVVLAAADTFRAASIEQLSEHARRLEVPIVKHDYGSDPASVGFDAIQYAKKHKIDVVLIDTAGRMHTQANLLKEMEKIARVTNPDLKIFVAESIAGNDATEQAKAFNEIIQVDGNILSKADIDEKGGTIISVSYANHKPIFYLGIGQNYEDLKFFNKQEYIASLGL